MFGQMLVKLILKLYVALNGLSYQPSHIYIQTKFYFENFIVFDSFLCLQKSLNLHRKHTRTHLRSARQTCNPHIPSAWAWHLTTPSSAMRSRTIQKTPANWLRRSADFITNICHFPMSALVICCKC